MRTIFISLFLFSSFLNAINLSVTDKSDYTISIQDPTIYYTAKRASSSLSLFYKADIESNGIRIMQGMGTTIVLWKSIKKIIIHSVKKDKISATIIKDALSMKVNLVKPIGNLEGTSALGIFSIDFKNIQYIDVK